MNKKTDEIRKMKTKAAEARRMQNHASHMNQVLAKRRSKEKRAKEARKVNR